MISVHRHSLLFDRRYLAVEIEAIETIDGHAHGDFFFTHILSFPSAEDLEREDAAFFNVPGHRFTIEDEGLRRGLDPLEKNKIKSDHGTAWL